MNLIQIGILNVVFCGVFGLNIQHPAPFTRSVSPVMNLKGKLFELQKEGEATFLSINHEDAAHISETFHISGQIVKRPNNESSAYYISSIGIGGTSMAPIGTISIRSEPKFAVFFNEEQKWTPEAFGKKKLLDKPFLNLVAFSTKNMNGVEILYENTTVRVVQAPKNHHFLNLDIRNLYHIVENGGTIGGLLGTDKHDLALLQKSGVMTKVASKVPENTGLGSTSMASFLNAPADLCPHERGSPEQLKTLFCPNWLPLRNLFCPVNIYQKVFNPTVNMMTEVNDHLGRCRDAGVLMERSASVSVDDASGGRRKHSSRGQTQSQKTKGCKKFFIPIDAVPSHNGRLWEYYHFLVDFAPIVHYHLTQVVPKSTSCPILQLPGWHRDDKFSFTLRNFPERTMQKHFHYLLGEPLNLTIELVPSRQNYPNYKKYAKRPDFRHDGFINASWATWKNGTYKTGEMEWANQPAEYFTTFRDYAKHKPGLTPIERDVVTVKRNAPPETYKGPPTGAGRRKLNDTFYADFMEDMERHHRSYSILNLEDEDMQRQIQLFSGAKIIIAQHGAALSNMLFSPPDGTIIEVGHRDYLCYENLARKLGLSYVHFEEPKYPKAEDVNFDLVHPNSARNFKESENSTSDSGYEARVHEWSNMVSNAADNMLAKMKRGSKASCPKEAGTCFGPRFYRQDVEQKFHNQDSFGYDPIELGKAIVDAQQRSTFSSPRGDPGQSLCMNGRLAPSLFIIGVQKGATTTLAGRLATSPSFVFGANQDSLFNHSTFPNGKPNPAYGKEQNFFNQLAKPKRNETAIQEYLARFPACDENNFQVGLDASVNYFISGIAPGAIKEMYADYVPKLKFIVTLREPIHRTHSAYHHAKSYCNSDDDVVWGNILCNETFNDHMRSGLMLPKEERTKDTLFVYNEYVPNFRRWFQHFAPSQFLIVPMRYLTDQAENPWLFQQYIWESLRAQVASEHVPALNRHPHPPLDGDIESGVRMQLEDMYSGTSQELAKVFDENEGTKLWGCSKCNLDEKERWIREHW